jgi:hypothetical protein
MGHDVECAWHLIVERLKELDKLDNYEKISEIRNWIPGGAGGPRKLVHKGETPF